MKFRIEHTGGYKKLNKEYVKILIDNGFKIEEIGEYTYIEIETLNDLIKIKQCVDKEIILADVWNCEDVYKPIKTTETLIEIYDDYRE